MINISCALIVSEIVKKWETATTSKLKIEEICYKELEVEESKEAEKDEDEFYILEELEVMENQSYTFMVMKFPNIRFKEKKGKASKQFF